MTKELRAAAERAIECAAEFRDAVLNGRGAFAECGTYEVNDVLNEFDSTVGPALDAITAALAAEQMQPTRWEDADDARTAEWLRKVLRREPTLAEVTEAQKACAPAEQPQPVSGWQTVPVEPTGAMWDAAWRSIGLPYRAKLSYHEIKTLFDAFYLAMLAAAPPLPPPAAAPIPVVCRKCGADRTREDCRIGNRIDCGFVGVAQSTPAAAPAEQPQPARIDPMQNPLRPTLAKLGPAGEHPAEEVLRRLACWLGVGGYNAPTVDADLFHRKIVDGIQSMLAERPAPAEQPQPSVGVQACRPEDRAMLATPAGAQLVEKVAQALAVPRAVADAPERIWLQVSDDAEDLDEPWTEDAWINASWCWHSAMAAEVEYVRADLAAPPPSAPEPSEVTDEMVERVRLDLYTLSGGDFDATPGEARATIASVMRAAAAARNINPA